MSKKSSKKNDWTRTKPTKEGFFFILLSLIIGFAALNTGNNLLYIIFGITLSLVAISGVVSMINISAIDVNLDSHSDIFALTPGNLWITVKNNKKYIPSYSITINIQNRNYYLDKINSGKSENLRVKSFFKERGINNLPEISISTQYPFGFFKKWMSMNFREKDVVVFPRIISVSKNEDFLEISIGENSSKKDGKGDELKSLKEYHEGDNRKDIHWKISAKMNKLISKEYFNESNRNIKIDFNPPALNNIELEKYISKKASTYLQLIKEGYDVEFAAPGKTFVTSKGNTKDKKVLTYLALYGRLDDVAA